MAARYAIYYAPPAGSPLEAFGRTWLGRDASTGEVLAQPGVPGLPTPRLADLTADPRRYGFHGTLKPPFALADGTTEAELFAAVDAFAATCVPFQVPALTFTEIGRFLALTPGGLCSPLNALADSAVMHFDRFRRPADDQELARRRRSGLTAKQDAYLERWGYPYVMDEFRFHLTLTGSIADAGERDALKGYLSEATRPFTGNPLLVDALTVFVQPAPDRPFRIARRATAGNATIAASAPKPPTPPKAPS